MKNSYHIQCINKNTGKYKMVKFKIDKLENKYITDQEYTFSNLN